MEKQFFQFREYADDAPCATCFRMVALDDKYWNEQVRHPAAGWMACGSHGAPNQPAEALATAHLPGLAVDGGDGDEKGVRRRQANGDNRIAKRKRVAAEREGLAAPKRSEGDGKGNSKRFATRKSPVRKDPELLLPDPLRLQSKKTTREHSGKAENNPWQPGDSPHPKKLGQGFCA